MLFRFFYFYSTFVVSLKSTFYLEISRFTFKISGTVSTVYNRNDEDNVDIVGEANSMELVKALKDVVSYNETTNEIQQYRNLAGRWRYLNQQITMNFKVNKPLALFQESINLDKY